MDPGAAAAFSAHPHAAAALRLRRRDDAAKIAGLEVPDLESYRPLLQALLDARDAG